MTAQSPLQFENQKLQLELVRDLGLMAFKFLLTLNTGAFIVLLTFIGNVTKNTMFQVEIADMQYAMYAFLASLVSLILAIFVTYLSAQLNLLGKSLPLSKNGMLHIAWMVIPTFASFSIFCYGAVTAISSFSIPN